MTTNTSIILVAFVVYMGIMILIGAMNSKQKNNEDYFLGGRGLGSWTAALSAQASDMSGWLLMGLPGAVYYAGTGDAWIAIGLLIGTILNWYFVARRLRKYTIVANNSLTIPSFFENRFHDKKGVLKVVASIVIIVFFAVYTASAFASGAKLFSTVFVKTNPGYTTTADGIYDITLNTEAENDEYLSVTESSVSAPIPAGATMEDTPDDPATKDFNEKTAVLEEKGVYLITNKENWDIMLVDNNLKFEQGASDSEYVLKGVSLEADTQLKAVQYSAEDGNTMFPKDNSDQMYLIGLAIAAVVILVYTLLGGFKAVCYTDFIQGMLMLVAILAVPIIAYVTVTKDFGSLSSALSAKGVADPAGYLNLMKDSSGESITAVSIISNLGWALGYFGMPHILVRFMAIKSDKEVKKSRVIAIVWVILSLGAACILGLVARGYLSTRLTGNTKETVFIRSILQIFDGNFVLIFIGGVFLCGILAAIMSTADSQLLVTASAVSEDVYKGTIKKNATDKSALTVGRISVVVVAIIAFVIALNPNSSVMSLVSDAWAGFGAAFGPVILLSLFWKRFNLPGAVAGMVTGFATVIIWDYIPFGGSLLADTTSLYSLVVGFTLALAAAFIVTLITKKPSAEIEAEFDKVKTIEL